MGSGSPGKINYEICLFPFWPLFDLWDDPERLKIQILEKFEVIIEFLV